MKYQRTTCIVCAPWQRSESRFVQTIHRKWYTSVVNIIGGIKLEGDAHSSHGFQKTLKPKMDAGPIVCTVVRHMAFGIKLKYRIHRRADNQFIIYVFMLILTWLRVMLHLDVQTGTTRGLVMSHFTGK